MKTPSDVAHEIKAFVNEHDGVDYTFAHIVLSDYNLSRGDIYSCFETENMRTWAKDHIMNADNEFGVIEKHYTNTAAAIAFLRYLRTYNDEFLGKVAEIL